jgi:hypothetical protein
VNVKKLVLERIPIFLHERPKCLLNYAALQRQVCSYFWPFRNRAGFRLLTAPAPFVKLEVFEARSLLLRRTLTLSASKKVKEEASSAAAFREKSRIRLLVSASVELDLYGAHD